MWQLLATYLSNNLSLPLDITLSNILIGKCDTCLLLSLLIRLMSRFLYYKYRTIVLSPIPLATSPLQNRNLFRPRALIRHIFVQSFHVFIRTPSLSNLSLSPSFLNYLIVIMSCHYVCVNLSYIYVILSYIYLQS